MSPSTRPSLACRSRPSCSPTDSSTAGRLAWLKARWPGDRLGLAGLPRPLPDTDVDRRPGRPGRRLAGPLGLGDLEARPLCSAGLPRLGPGDRLPCSWPWTGEMASISGFGRSFGQLTTFVFPTEQWLQLSLPELFLKLKGGPNDPFWANRLTTGGEASCYVGTAPLILALVGWIGPRKDRGAGPLGEPRDDRLGPARLPPPALARRLPRRHPHPRPRLVPGAVEVYPADEFGARLAGRSRAGPGDLDRPVPLGMGAGPSRWASARSRRGYLPDLLHRIAGEPRPRRRSPVCSASPPWPGSAPWPLIAAPQRRSGKVGGWLLVALTAIELGLLYREALPSTWAWNVPLADGEPDPRGASAHRPSRTSASSWGAWATSRRRPACRSPSPISASPRRRRITCWSTPTRRRSTTRPTSTTGAAGSA